MLFTEDSNVMQMIALVKCYLLKIAFPSKYIIYQMLSTEDSNVI